jgi:hypothetical protein
MMRPTMSNHALTYTLTRCAPIRWFRINGGDGDQDLFQHSLIIERVEAAWFDGATPLGRGAWLMRVSGGPKAGLLFAILPRTLGSIEDGIAQSGFKSVIITGLLQPEAGPMAYPETSIGGMTFMELV